MKLPPTKVQPINGPREKKLPYLYWDKEILIKLSLNNHPDITLHGKTNKIVYLIDVSIPNCLYHKNEKICRIKH